MNEFEASLAVVFHNEEKRIDRFFDHLLRSGELAFFRELVLVDNASTDSTAELLSLWRKRLQEALPDLKLRLLTNSENHLGSARALAVEESSAEWVAFIDADCFPPAGWALKMSNQANKLFGQNHQLGGVCGANRLPESSKLFSALNLMMDSFLGNGGSPQSQSPDNVRVVDHLPTTNAFFRRSAVLESGNFSRQLPRFGEDLDLGSRMREKNYSLHMVPGATLINESASTLKEWCRRMHRFGRAQILVGRQGRRCFHRRRWIPLITLPLAIGSLSLPFFLSIHARGIMLAAFVAVILLMTFFWQSSSTSKRSWRVAGLAVFTLFLSHLCYSLGEWRELLAPSSKI